MKMRKFKQDKLWRDKLPDVMTNLGSVIHIKQLTDQEYDAELRIKLLEEADEVKAAKNNTELIGELADVFEVIDAMIALHGINKNEIVAAQEQKRNQRGGFIERKFVTIAEHAQGSFGETYCLEQPTKYPEIK